MYTLDEMILLLKDRYEPQEIIEIVKIESEDLIIALAGYIEEDFERIYEKIIEDEQSHFGVSWGRGESEK